MSDFTPRARELAAYEPSALVPVGYAEKSMASLMQLHSELMDEKERRVDLYRRLMDKEQTIAELRMYVKMLEEKVATENERGWNSPRSNSAPATQANVANSAAPRPQMRPPQPPRPLTRERSRFALKPRSINEQAGPATRSGARRPQMQGSDEPGARQSRPAAIRPEADGWRAW